MVGLSNSGASNSNGSIEHEYDMSIPGHLSPSDLSIPLNATSSHVYRGLALPRPAGLSQPPSDVASVETYADEIIKLSGVLGETGANITGATAAQDVTGNSSRHGKREASQRDLADDNVHDVTNTNDEHNLSDRDGFLLTVTHLDFGHWETAPLAHLALAGPRVLALFGALTLAPHALTVSLNAHLYYHYMSLVPWSVPVPAPLNPSIAHNQAISTFLQTTAAKQLLNSPGSQQHEQLAVSACLPRWLGMPTFATMRGLVFNDDASYLRYAILSFAQQQQKQSQNARLASTQTASASSIASPLTATAPVRKKIGRPRRVGVPTLAEADSEPSADAQAQSASSASTAAPSAASVSAVALVSATAAANTPAAVASMTVGTNKPVSEAAQRSLRYSLLLRAWAGVAVNADVVEEDSVHGRRSFDEYSRFGSPAARAVLVAHSHQLLAFTADLTLLPWGRAAALAAATAAVGATAVPMLGDKLAMMARKLSVARGGKERAIAALLAVLLHKHRATDSVRALTANACNLTQQPQQQQRMQWGPGGAAVPLGDAVLISALTQDARTKALVLLLMNCETSSPLVLSRQQSLVAAQRQKALQLHVGSLKQQQTRAMSAHAARALLQALPSLAALVSAHLERDLSYERASRGSVRLHALSSAASVFVSKFAGEFSQCFETLSMTSGDHSRATALALSVAELAARTGGHTLASLSTFTRPLHPWGLLVATIARALCDESHFGSTQTRCDTTLTTCAVIIGALSGVLTLPEILASALVQSPNDSTLPVYHSVLARAQAISQLSLALCSGIESVTDVVLRQSILTTAGAVTSNHGAGTAHENDQMCDLQSQLPLTLVEVSTLTAIVGTADASASYIAAITPSPTSKNAISTVTEGDNEGSGDDLGDGDGEDTPCPSVLASAQPGAAVAAKDRRLAAVRATEWSRSPAVAPAAAPATALCSFAVAVSLLERYIDSISISSPSVGAMDESVQSIVGSRVVTLSPAALLTVVNVVMAHVSQAVSSGFTLDSRTNSDSSNGDAAVQIALRVVPIALSLLIVLVPAQDKSADMFVTSGTPTSYSSGSSASLSESASASSGASVDNNWKSLDDCESLVPAPTVTDYVCRHFSRAAVDSITNRSQPLADLVTKSKQFQSSAGLLSQAHQRWAAAFAADLFPQKLKEAFSPYRPSPLVAQSAPSAASQIAATTEATLILQDCRLAALALITPLWPLLAAAAQRAAVTAAVTTLSRRLHPQLAAAVRSAIAPPSAPSMSDGGAGDGSGCLETSTALAALLLVMLRAECQAAAAPGGAVYQLVLSAYLEAALALTPSKISQKQQDADLNVDKSACAYRAVQPWRLAALYNTLPELAAAALLPLPEAARGIAKTTIPILRSVVLMTASAMASYSKESGNLPHLNSSVHLSETSRAMLDVVELDTEDRTYAHVNRMKGQMQTTNQRTEFHTALFELDWARSVISHLLMLPAPQLQHQTQDRSIGSARLLGSNGSSATVLPSGAALALVSPEVAVFQRLGPQKQEDMWRLKEKVRDLELAAASKGPRRGASAMGKWASRKRSLDSARAADRSGTNGTDDEALEEGESDESDASISINSGSDLNTDDDNSDDDLELQPQEQQRPGVSDDQSRLASFFGLPVSSFAKDKAKYKNKNTEMRVIVPQNTAVNDLNIINETAAIKVVSGDSEAKTNSSASANISSAATLVPVSKKPRMIAPKLVAPVSTACNNENTTRDGNSNNSEPKNYESHGEDDFFISLLTRTQATGTISSNCDIKIKIELLSADESTSAQILAKQLHQRGQGKTLVTLNPANTNCALSQYLQSLPLAARTHPITSTLSTLETHADALAKRTALALSAAVPSPLQAQVQMPLCAAALSTALVALLEPFLWAAAARARCYTGVRTVTGLRARVAALVATAKAKRERKDQVRACRQWLEEIGYGRGDLGSNRGRAGANAAQIGVKGSVRGRRKGFRVQVRNAAISVGTQAAGDTGKLSGAAAVSRAQTMGLKVATLYRPMGISAAAAAEARARLAARLCTFTAADSVEMLYLAEPWRSTALPHSTLLNTIFPSLMAAFSAAVTALARAMPLATSSHAVAADAGAESDTAFVPGAARLASVVIGGLSLLLPTVIPVLVDGDGAAGARFRLQAKYVRPLAELKRVVNELSQAVSTAISVAAASRAAASNASDVKHKSSSSSIAAWTDSAQSAALSATVPAPSVASTHTAGVTAAASGSTASLFGSAQLAAALRAVTAVADSTKTSTNAGIGRRRAGRPRKDAPRGHGNDSEVDDVDLVGNNGPANGDLTGFSEAAKSSNVLCCLNIGNTLCSHDLCLHHSDDVRAPHDFTSSAANSQSHTTVSATTSSQPQPVQSLSRAAYSHLAIASALSAPLPLPQCASLQSLQPLLEQLSADIGDAFTAVLAVADTFAVDVTMMRRTAILVGLPIPPVFEDSDSDSDSEAEAEAEAEEVDDDGDDGRAARICPLNRPKS